METVVGHLFCIDFILSLNSSAYAMPVYMCSDGAGHWNKGRGQALASDSE